MVYIRFPTLQDVNACFQVDGLIETDYVWQVQRTIEPARVSFTLQRVRLPRTMRLPYPPLGDSLIRRYEERDGLWVAVDGGQVVGFVEMVWDAGDGVAWLHHLVVDRERRRQGVGSALLWRAAQAARERGLDRVLAVVNVKNDPAIQFLQNNGFTCVGYNEAHFSHGDIAMYMARSLARWPKAIR